MTLFKVKILGFDHMLASIKTLEASLRRILSRVLTAMKNPILATALSALGLIFAALPVVSHSNQTEAPEPTHSAETITSGIPGFAELAAVLSSTSPGSDNVGEWRRIREHITIHSNADDEVRFYELVRTLSEIHPTRDNKGEWSAIRRTSNQILAAWDTTDRRRLFHQLLTRLNGIRPGRDNKAEWSRIRARCEELLLGVSAI